MRRLIIITALAIPAILAAGRVQARPRDEVMSGAYRCGSIGDNRDWLDCYYGAAQPVRAALGLVPASERQQALVVSPASGVAAAGDAAARDHVLAEASRCYQVTGDRQWLDCYYASAQPVRTLLGLALAVRPDLSTIAGMPNPAERDRGSGKSVSARMTGFSFDGYRWFTVTLDNGQVWRQISGDTSYARWKEPAGRYSVRITPGFAGSFNLRVIGHAGLYKVTRVR